MLKERQENLDFATILKILRKYYRTIIITSVMGLIVSLVLIFILLSPKYASSVDILVNQKKTSVEDNYTTQQADLQTINTYKDILKREVILAPVLQKIKHNDNYKGNFSDLSNSIEVENKTSSQIITVTAKDANPYVAMDMANSVADVFSGKIKKIMDIDNVLIVSRASVNKKAVSPNKKVYVILGIVAGVIVGILTALLKESMNTKVISEEELKNELGLNILGSVYHLERKNSYKNEIRVLEQDSHNNSARRI